MIILFARHGETHGNVGGIIQGHLEGELTQRGIEQARMLAVRLSSEKIDAIYSSDLKRAADTAREIARFHKDVPFSFSSSLRERGFGNLEGRMIADIDLQMMDKESYLSSFNVERAEDVFSRADALVDELFLRHADDKVLLVGHADIGRAIIGKVLGKSHRDYNEIAFPDNTSLSVLEMDASGNNRAIVINCTRHLN